MLVGDVDIVAAVLVSLLLVGAIGGAVVWRRRAGHARAT